MRDLHRHAWQEALVAELVRRRPDLVVVEMGLPARRPAAAGCVRTYGAARVSVLAAVELMLDA